MTQWWADFTGWLETLNWGSVADWFAAIGTVGALFLGLAILNNERTRHRRELADSFSIWWEITTSAVSADPSDTRTELRLRVFNAGPLPVHDAGLVVDPPPDHRHYVIESIKWDPSGDTNDIDDIEPGERHVYVRTLDDMPDMNDYALSFIDGKGRPWLKNLQTGKYMEPKRRRPWARRKKR